MFTLALMLIAYSGEQNIVVENIGFVSTGTQMTRIVDREHDVVCYVAQPVAWDSHKPMSPAISCIKLEKK